ncbi:MAG: FHA domain-containing protein [Thauera phenolivorans]|uniref:FHA domain-containing protein n=1 Tax=Thauera phenolivorans TaxID=1792543 RepID=A0A7X7LUH8_9RHOO|nr:FHA domain-containing protein [Thauera phenolivorans]
MPERRNLCMLVAVPGGTAEPDALPFQDGVREALARIVTAHGGTLLERRLASLAASFKSCDAALRAAREALEELPFATPAIVIHYGCADGGSAPTTGLAFAHRLAALARPGEGLASAAAVMLLDGPARQLASAQPLARDSFATLDWPVFAVGARAGTVTSMPALTRLSQRLRLRHQQDLVLVEELRPLVRLGRALGNDLVIMDARASRQHARIELRPDGFVLVDSSSNGTWVGLEGELETWVRDGELLLRGPGRLGCGFSTADIRRDLVFFDLV